MQYDNFQSYAFIKNELPDGSGYFGYGQWYNALTNQERAAITCE